MFDTDLERVYKRLRPSASSRAEHMRTASPRRSATTRPGSGCARSASPSIGGRYPKACNGTFSPSDATGSSGGAGRTSARSTRSHARAHVRGRDVLPRLRRQAKWMFVFLAIVFGLGYVIFNVGGSIPGPGSETFSRVSQTSNAGPAWTSPMTRSRKSPTTLKELSAISPPPFSARTGTPRRSCRSSATSRFARPTERHCASSVPCTWRRPALREQGAIARAQLTELTGATC